MNLNDAADIAQIVTGAGSLLVAGLAIRASRQISSQQQAVALAASRAYMATEPGRLTQLAAGKPVEMTLGAKNWGQTPAFKSRVACRVYLASKGADPMRGVPLRIEPQKAEVTVPPQQALQLSRVGKDDLPLSAEQYAAIKSGDLVIHADFLVEYFDVAGGRHETSIKYFVDAAHLAGEPAPFLSFGKNALSMS